MQVSQALQIPIYDCLLKQFEDEYTQFTTKIDNIENSYKYDRDKCGYQILASGPDQRPTEMIFSYTVKKLILIQEKLKEINSNPDESTIKSLHAKIQSVKDREEKFRKLFTDTITQHPLDVLEGRHEARLKGFRSITECHCTPNLNRQGNINSRYQFTMRLCRELRALKKENEELTLCSIGSGGCFLELDIHARLSSDYKIKWVLIDLDYERKPTPAQEFEIVAKFINQETRAEIFTDPDKYFKKDAPPKPDAIIAVDLGSNMEYVRGFKTMVTAAGHNCILGYLHQTADSLKIEK